MLHTLTMLSPIAVGMLAVGAVLITVGWMKTEAFLRTTPRLRDPSDMEQYKQLARFGMWAALALIPLMVLPFLVLIFLPASPEYRIVGWVGPVLLGVAGAKLKEKETAAQSLEAHSAEMAAERDRVTYTWMKKAFPDF